MRDYFFSLVDSLRAGLRGGEELLCGYLGEQSDFVRLNRCRVRQAGTVTQREFTVGLVIGARHGSATVDLGGDAEDDRAILAGVVDELRGLCAHLPDDPFLAFEREPGSSETHRGHEPVDSVAALEDTLEAARDLDLVGILASGVQEHGFASSLGGRHWHGVASFNLDYSACLEGDRAAKGRYAGFQWRRADLEARLAETREALARLGQPTVTVEPGRYRAYLAPAAVHEVTSMLAWGGFSLKSQQTRQSPLIALQAGQRRLDPRITLVEDHAGGLAPGFTSEGFIKPAAVTLVDQGRYGVSLAGARSAREYGVAVNAGSETPQSLVMAPGTLPAAEAAAALDTGIYVNNLWYLNYSDRNACRITGMTRYACFWVEGGRIRGPVGVMRFDDSAYRLLGDRLGALTAEREHIFEADTYGHRSVSTAHLPGALVDELILTL